MIIRLWLKAFLNGKTGISLILASENLLLLQEYISVRNCHEITFRFDMSKFDMSKFDMSKFDMSKFDMSKSTHASLSSIGVRPVRLTPPPSLCEFILRQN